MKIIPLTFFILILTLVSCDKNKNLNQENQNSEEIILLIEKTNNKELPFHKKEVLLDNAINLSKDIGHDSLLLQALSLKVYHSSNSSQDKTAQYILELEKNAKEKNKTKFIGYANLMKGEMFYKKVMYDSAYRYFKESNRYYFQEKDSLRIGYNLMAMAKLHLNHNDYSSAEELATEALQFIENINNKDYILEVYNFLGHAYLNTKNYQEAITFYDKALKLADDIEDQIVLKNNKASVYIHSGRYNHALQILEELFKIKEIDEHLNTKALVLFNLGQIRFRLNKTKGLEELEESLKINQNIDNQIGAIESHIKMAEFFEDKNKKTASKHLLKALDLSSKHNNIDNQINSLKILIRLSDKDELKHYSEQYIRLNDSITEVRQKSKNQFTKIRFDYSKEQEQNLFLKTKKAEDALLIQKQKNTNQLLFFGLIIIGISGISFYLILKNKHNREKIEENYKTENRIAVRIHDELANDVYNTIAYTENFDLSLEGNKLKLLNNLEDVYNRTRNISKENSKVDTGENYVKSLKNMLSEYQKDELKIIIAGADSILWKGINSHKKIIIYRVLQELMVNMKKHSNASMVMLRFENQGKSIGIYYSDDGIGLPNEKIIFKNGLQNVENRIKTINGTITFEPKTRKGLKILIAFPL